jgi:diguanylate cyclase (GGDEF)-like protein/PAS domain S-box-containing protein
VAATSSIRADGIHSRAAAIFVACTATYVAVLAALPTVGLHWREFVAGALAAYTLAWRLWVCDRVLSGFQSHLVGLAATTLVTEALLLDTSTWIAPAFVYAFVAFAFAHVYGPRDVALQLALVAAGFSVVAWLHTSAAAAAVLTLVVVGSLAGGAVIVGRLRDTALAEIDRGRTELEQRIADAEKLLRESKGRFRHLIEALPLVTYVSALDDRASALYVSPQIQGLLGYGVDEWMVDSDLRLNAVHHDDRARVVAETRHHHETGEPFRSEYRLCARDGRVIWVLDEAVIEFDSARRPLHSRGYIQEITERKELEAELAEHSLHDPLTGLPNRVLLLERLRHWAVRREPPPLAVLYVDLDDFKLVNDELGHAAGDEVLMEVARRLLTYVRPEDTIARMGGDEFAILVEGVDALGAEAIATRIVNAIAAAPVTVGDRDVPVSASVGVASAANGAVASEALLNRADLAMYAAKSAGKGQSAMYAPAIGSRVAIRLQMRLQITRALDRGEFGLHYQPIVDLTDGHIVGAEALLRWHHPTHGLVRPGDFIDVAVESGQIVPLGRWGLDEACRGAAQLREVTGLPLFVTFNLSLRELREADLVSAVEAALEEHSLHPDMLMLEITEEALLPDERHTTGSLHALRELGVRLAIDDFGTGYSSLSYLARVPADIVKLARPFVEALEQSGREAALARAVVRLCRDLDLPTIGEGIETEGQKAVLQELGCGLGQGYLFSEPVPLLRLIGQVESAQGSLNIGSAVG